MQQPNGLRTSLVFILQKKCGSNLPIDAEGLWLETQTVSPLSGDKFRGRREKQCGLVPNLVPDTWLDAFSRYLISLSEKHGSENSELGKRRIRSQQEMLSTHILYYYYPILFAKDNILKCREVSCTE